MEKYFIYILKSTFGYSYIGQTKNLEERLDRHNTNRSTYTKGKGKWEIEIFAKVATRKEAVALEKKLKSMKDVKKAKEYLKSLV